MLLVWGLQLLEKATISLLPRLFISLSELDADSTWPTPVHKKSICLLVLTSPEAFRSSEKFENLQCNFLIFYHLWRKKDELKIFCDQHTQI